MGGARAAALRRLSRSLVVDAREEGEPEEPQTRQAAARKAAIRTAVSVRSAPGAAVRRLISKAGSSKREEREEQPEKDSDGEDDDAEGAQDGASTAALRDATATASSSGHDHLNVSSHAARPSARAAKAASAASSSAVSGSTAVSRVKAAAKAGTAAKSDAGGNAVADTTEAGNAAQASAASKSDAADSAPGAVPVGKGLGHRLPSHVSSERDKELHDELAGCEDWRDVLDVLTDEAEALSLRTAVHALTRLNTLSRGLDGSVRRELAGLAPFRVLSEHVFSQIPDMNNVQLAMSLSAFAQLQVPLSEAVLGAYFAAAAARQEIFFPRDIAMYFSAAAALRCSPPQALLDGLSFRAKLFIIAGQFDSRSISSLLHSCVLLGYKNHILAQAAAEQLAAPGAMASLAPQGVANSMWALARMDCYHAPTVEAALAAFAAQPLSYKPQECANLLWALTAFRHHPEGSFVHFARSLLHHEHKLRAADLATLLYALATFNVLPGGAVLDRICGRISTLLGADPGPLKSKAKPSSRASGSEDSAASGSGSGSGPGSGSGFPNAIELVNLYWGLALLGESGRPVCRQLEGALVAHVEGGGELPVSLQRMLFQAFLAVRLADSQQTALPFPPLMFDGLKRAWINNINDLTGASKRNGKDGKVTTRRQIGEVLNSLKVRHDTLRPTGDNLAVIDFALKAGPEQYVALQLLEKEERCVNSKQLLGTVVLQRQLLERNGWEVRFLSSRDFWDVAPEARPLFIAELLRRCGIRGVGGKAKPTEVLPPGKAAAGAKERAPEKKGDSAEARTREAREAKALADLEKSALRRPARRGGK